jgi:hypothetical protein
MIKNLRGNKNFKFPITEKKAADVQICKINKFSESDVD